MTEFNIKILDALIIAAKKIGAVNVSRHSAGDGEEVVTVATAKGIHVFHKKLGSKWREMKPLKDNLK